MRFDQLTLAILLAAAGEVGYQRALRAVRIHVLHRPVRTADGLSVAVR